MIGAAIAKIARTAVSGTESAKLPFVASIVAALGTLSTIQGTTEAVLFIRFQTYIVATGALWLRLTNLFGIADRLAAGTNPTLSPTSVGTTFLAIAVWLAEAFPVGVAGKSGITFPANPTAAVGSAILLFTVRQALP